jgi:branched-chain amino acid transport system substrate-binding protein
MSRKLWPGAPALGALGVLLLAGCGGASGSQDGAGSDSDPIVIGIASAQTGSFTLFDVPVKNGIELAVAEYNEAGGVDGRPLEIVVSDTKSDVQLSASAAIEVLDEGADFVVTMCDYNLGAPAATEADSQGKIALACAGSALFGPVGVGPLAYSVNESSESQGSGAAEFAASKGWKTAYLLGDMNEDYSGSWCSSFKETFTELNGEGAVLGEDTFVNGDTTIAPQVSALRASGETPDVVALCGYPPTGATAVSQLRAAGVTSPIVSTAGFDGPGWLDAVPGVSDVYAAVGASIYGDDPSAKVNEVVRKYAAEYGDPTSAYLTFGYAMVEAIAAAVERAGSTEGTEVAAALDAFDAEELILGPTTYTAGCHVALGRDVRILEYRDGVGRYLESLTPKKSHLPEGCTE